MTDETSPNIRRTESGYRFELSGLRSACADAMIFIGSAGSQDAYNQAINQAIAALDALEDHLAPYWDLKFKTDKYGAVVKGTKDKRDGTGYLGITIKSLEELKKENPDVEDPEIIERKADELRLEALRQQQRARYQALMRLQDRNNLLLEEETEDYAGD